MRKRFMVDSRPLYNSRNIKVWIEYLQRYHPEAKLNAILTHSAIGMDEVEDGATGSHRFRLTAFMKVHDSKRATRKSPEKPTNTSRLVVDLATSTSSRKVF